MKHSLDTISFSLLRKGETYLIDIYFYSQTFLMKTLQTIQFLDSLKEVAYSDSVTFEELAREYPDDITSSFGGYFTDAMGGENVLVEELDPVIFLLSTLWMLVIYLCPSRVEQTMESLHINLSTTKKKFLLI